MTRHRPPLLDLKLTLADAPTVWRRVRMSSGATLARAQRVFCVSFGWPGGRPYGFSTGAVHYTSRSAADPLTGTRLRHMLPDAGSTMEFDYGEPPWHVDVRVERVLPPNDAIVAPQCLDGEGEPPHVDSGGAWAWHDDRSDQEAATRPTIRVNVYAINAELERLP